MLGIEPAFHALLAAIRRWEPSVAGRVIVPGRVGPIDPRGGLGELDALHALTAGEQVPAKTVPLGVCGGMELLGRAACEAARATWASLPREPGEPEVIAMPGGRYRSVPAGAVRDVYFSMGWYPVLREPLEANYVAIDTTPGPAGHVGQVVAVGRDEEIHAVLAPDLASFLELLRRQVDAGEWELVAEEGPRVPAHVRHREGPLLSVLVKRAT